MNTKKRLNCRMPFSCKRGQIALVVLIAIIIIAGAGAFIFLSKQKAERLNPTEELKVRANEITKSETLKFYVESCLEEATKEGVWLVGRQGGYIYETDMPSGAAFLGPGGSFCEIQANLCTLAGNVLPNQPSNPSRLALALGKETEYVKYSIEKGKEVEPPAYPYLGPLRDYEDIYTFGNVKGGEKKNKLIELCYANGSNSRDLEGAKNSCVDSYSTFGKEGNSIQAYLERYIEHRVKECVDFSSLPNSTLKGVKARPGNLTASVVFGDNDVQVDMDYEILLTFPGADSTKAEARFAYTLDGVRLKMIYELAQSLMRDDTNSIFFDTSDRQDLLSLTNCMDVETGKTNAPCLKEGMRLDRVKNPCPAGICTLNKDADLLMVIDEHSLIYDEPFIFQFAIEDRSPALDLIAQELSQEMPYYSYLATLGKASPNIYKKQSYPDASFDIVVGNGDLLEIYPLAADPDDGVLIYNYISSDGGDLGGRLLSSSLYEDTGRDGSIIIGRSDIGQHKVRLVVIDEDGKSDWQDLKIMVCDTDSDCEKEDRKHCCK